MSSGKIQVGRPRQQVNFGLEEARSLCRLRRKKRSAKLPIWKVQSMELS